MRSDAQREASRKNGAKSHGPATDHGKTNSSQNSYRHGLTAKRSLSTTENTAVYVKHLEAYHEKFQPVDDVERNIVDAMALCHWRERRAWSKEAAMIDIEMDRMSAKVDEKYGKVDHAVRYALAFKSLCDKSNSMSLLIRYENSHRRDFHRKLLDLIEIRKALPPPPTDPAQPLETSDDPTMPDDPPEYRTTNEQPRTTNAPQGTTKAAHSAPDFDETNLGSNGKQTNTHQSEPGKSQEPENTAAEACRRSKLTFRNKPGTIVNAQPVNNLHGQPIVLSPAIRAGRRRCRTPQRRLQDAPQLRVSLRSAARRERVFPRSSYRITLQWNQEDQQTEIERSTSKQNKS